MVGLDDLKTRYREKVEGVAFEQRAAALLDHFAGTDPVDWARHWAELHDQQGVRCDGFPSWREWAEQVK